MGQTLNDDQLNKLLQKYNDNTHQYLKTLNGQNKNFVQGIMGFVKDKQCRGHVLCVQCKKICCHCCNSPIENGCGKFLDWKFQQKHNCDNCKCHINHHQMILCVRKDCNINGGPPQIEKNGELVQLL